MPFADVNDQRIHYRVDGPDDPEATVVFSHGFLMDHEMFEPQVSALADRYRCVRWDMRRHGQTGSTAEPFSVRDITEDLLGLLDMLGVDRAVFVGFSFGGWVSVRAALQRPELVTGLAILDSYEAMEAPEAIEAYRQFQQMIAEQGFDDVVTATMTGFLFHPDYDPSYWVGKWRSRSPLEWKEPYEAMFTRDDVNDRLGEITCPAVVLHGEGNIANPPEISADLCARLGNCSPLVVVPGAGHTSNLEQPEFVTGQLTEFIAATTGK